VSTFALVALALAAPGWTGTIRAADASSDCPLNLLAEAGEQSHGKPSKWWVSEEGRREFGLSEAQSRDLEAVFQSVMPALKAHKIDVDRYQKELSALLGDVKARESDVGLAVDRLEAAQSALSKTRTLMLFRMYRLLTPEQRAKVQAHYDQRGKETDNKDGRRYVRVAAQRPPPARTPLPACPPSLKEFT